MTQTPQMGLQVPAPSPSSHRVRSSRALVLGVVVAGVLSVAGALVWFEAHPTPDGLIRWDQTPLVAALLIVAVVSELMFFPVRHGDGFEELTYFEFVMIGALLLFTPSVALPLLVAGTIIAEWILRRPPIKRLFNAGSYGIATSALFVSYWALADHGDLFSAQSIVALFVAALIWGTINMLLLSWILQVAEHIPIREFLTDKGQWIPTLIVAFLSVSVAASFVALIPVAPTLTVFTVVPTAVLWFVYQAAQRRSEAVERLRYMVALSNTLSMPQDPVQLTRTAADSVRRVFGAEDVLIVVGAMSYLGSRDAGEVSSSPAQPTELQLAATADRTARPIPAALVPKGWRDGVVITLDLGERQAAALALGASSGLSGLERRMPWARGGRNSWALKSEDAPVLTSLAGSLSSAIRASQLLADLRGETAKLTAVVDNANDGIAVFDGAGSVVLWSPAMEFITGVSQSVAQDPAAVAELEGLQVLAELRGSDTGAEGRFVTITRTDDELRELNVAVVPLDDEAQLSVMTVRDVTQQRRVERMKSDFIATVSHELRTPITPIKGYARLLATRWERMTPEKRSTVLETIEERANHLSRLVDDLLLASRVSEIDETRLDVDLTDADLSDLIEETMDTFPNLAKRVQIVGTDVTVRCDRGRAVQCLSNLIGNAGKYSPDDAAIQVEYGRTDGQPWAVVAVTDHGRGIPADALERVFERFYRVEDPMTMTTGGSGLGLFISRELARAMGGDISVESELGKGSTFRLRLPVSEETT